MKKILILLLSFLILHADKDETYLDKNTGLIWQNNSDVGVVVKAWMDLNTAGAMRCMFGGDQDSCTDTNGDTASSYCQNLQLDGLNGWRVPTIEELASLDDTLRADSQKKKGSFWSSTSELYKGKATEAAYIMMYSTKENHRLTRDKNNKMFVRCVNNQAQDTVQQNIVVIDKTMYQNHHYPKKMDWPKAKEYCKNLDYNGFSDWKLPTHQELEKVSRVDIYYALGDYKNLNDYFKQHLEKAKVHVASIKKHRHKSKKGSELIVKDEFLEEMPLINDRHPIGEFWASDERDKNYVMSLDFRNAMAWWTTKDRKNYVLCTRKK